MADLIESGWVIERGEACAPEYLSVEHELITWTKDHMRAIRCARREDADRLAELVIEEDCRICEHEWSGAPSIRPIAPEPAGEEEEQSSGILWSSDAMRQFDFGKTTLTGGPQDAEPAGEVGDLVAALEFYRDDAWAAEWEGDEDGVTGCELVPSKALTKDCGERARTALAAYTARKGGGNVG